VAHKTGTVGGTVNDAGIIFLPNDQGTLLISVLSSGTPSMNVGSLTIAKIARAAYDYFEKTEISSIR
jgi:beta-lactamase class A